jgi:hypothetical protein
MTAGHPAARRPAVVALVLTVALAVLLAACGGGNGGGGGGGGTSVKLHLLLVNGEKKDVTVSYTAGGTAQPDQTLAQCTATIYDLPMADPFQVSVDGTVVLDSSTVAGGIPDQFQSDIVAEVDLDSSGKATVASLNLGSLISKPAALSICAP